MSLLIEILIVVIILGLALWIVDQIPASAEYAWVKRIVKVVLAVIVVVWLLFVLLSLLPLPGPHLLR